MSLSDQDLQNYVGRSLNDVQKELENQGYKVHTVRTGNFATGFVPAKRVEFGEEAPKSEKRAIIVFDGNDPQHKVTSIRQD